MIELIEEGQLIKQFCKNFSFVNLLSDKILGCREKCPFCLAPCCYSMKDHAGSHQANQHYPVGIRGIHGANNKLQTYNCQSAVDSDIPYCYDFNKPKMKERYRDYKK